MRRTTRITAPTPGRLRAICTHRRRLSTASATAGEDEDVAARYQRDGAVVIRGLLSGDEVSSLREAIDYNMAHPGPLAGVASSADDPGLFFEDFCNWQRVPGYQRLIFESALPSVAAQLMRSSVVRLYHDHVLVKEPRTEQHTPFHQDQPYYIR